MITVAARVPGLLGMELRHGPCTVAWRSQEILFVEGLQSTWHLYILRYVCVYSSSASKLRTHVITISQTGEYLEKPVSLSQQDTHWIPANAQVHHLLASLVKG